MKQNTTNCRAKFGLTPITVLGHYGRFDIQCPCYCRPADLDQTFNNGAGKVVTNFQLDGASVDYGDGVATDGAGRTSVGYATNGNKKGDFA